MPFEACVRSQCSRALSSRGRPQQCARSAARTSSARFGSRGSSARSRSSTRSQRPSAEVELRGEASGGAALAKPPMEESATSYVAGLFTNAMDDIVTELDYYSDDESLADPSSVSEAVQVLGAGEPVIIEEPEDNELNMTAISEEASDLVKYMDCCSDGEEADDGDDACDFSSEVCSMASENPDGEEDIDDFLVAVDFAKTAVSDDLILEAFGDAREEEEKEKEEELDEVECVEFLGEEAACGDELAFDYASDILDVAFVQATTTWTKQKQTELQVTSLAMPALELLKEKAKQSLLKYAREKDAQDMHIESLRRKARESLLKAALAKASPVDFVPQDAELEQVRLQVQQAFFDGLQNGALANALGEASRQEGQESLRSKLQETLLKGAASGELQAALKQVLATSERDQSKDEEDAKFKVQQALRKGLHNGGLSRAFGQVLEKDKWAELQSKMQQNLAKATASGKLAGALSQVMRKEESLVETQQSKGFHNGGLATAFGASPENDRWAQLQQKMAETLVKASASGALAGALNEAMQQTEAHAPSTAASAGPQPPAETLKEDTEKLKEVIEASKDDMRAPATPSRSRRRIIGGVVRTPAIQEDMQKEPSSTMRKTRSKSDKEPVAFRMDFGIESAGEEDTKLARASSLTRNYDALGVQFYSLAGGDEPASPKPSTPSRTRTRLLAATSMSAISMELKPTMSAMAMDMNGTFRSPSASMRRSGSSSGFSSKFAPVPFNLEYSTKMRPSASMGSLSSSKMKHSSGGLLPTIAPERKSAESIAWTMQVSKTTSGWGNTGLRGSASMIF